MDNISILQKKKYTRIFKQFKKVNYIINYFTFPYLIVLVIPEDSIILDLGTGHGLVLIKFASKISSEGHVTGIDLWKNRDQSNNSFKSTQQLLQEKNLENRSDLKTSDMIELPFEDKKYDFVTASMAIHNIKPKQNRYKALDEATRVLKTEGLLIILDT